MPDLVDFPTTDPAVTEIARGRAGGAGVLLGTALLVALVWLIGLGVPSHRPLDAASGSDFPGDPDAWALSGSSGSASFGRGVTLRPSGPEPNRLFFRVPFERPPDDVVLIRVSGRGTEGRTDGPPSGTAALGIRFETASGEGRYRNVRFAPERRRDARFTKVLGWPAAYPVARVGLVSRPGAPPLTIADARVELVRANPRYAAALGVLGVLVALWSAWLLRFVHRHRAFGALVAPFTLALVIAVGVGASATVLGPLTRPLVAAAGELFALEPVAALKILFKGGHGLAFFLLALALLRVRARLGASTLGIVALLLLVAIGSEGVQAHLPGREPSLVDVAIDAVGIALAVLMASLVGRFAAIGQPSEASQSSMSR